MYSRIIIVKGINNGLFNFIVWYSIHVTIVRGINKDLLQKETELIDTINLLGVITL
jgi:hypothetical protein